MKVFLIILVIAGASAFPELPLKATAMKSFADLKKMSKLDKIKHVRDNCPHLKYDDETLASSLDENMEAEDDGSGVKKGFTCMSAVPKADFLSALAVKVPEHAKNRPSFADGGRTKRQTAPSSVDWRSKGYVTPVEDQGQCGSCWTFSANGAMEGAIFKKTGKLPNLSEQNLVDCVKASSGCNGGWMTDAYDYSNSTGGISLDSSYPYTATEGTCKAITTNGGKVTKYYYTKQGDETDLKNKLATVGPIAVAIDATNIQNYVSGVYTCTTFTDVNHGVLLVGYGTDSASGKDYWLIKNSWGTSWGESGYIRIARNKGSNAACGTPLYANYPTA